jgi:signal transduction histidine kinase/CheY-like chemotaxis protein/HPt (histidine-containing phosphotransfer) domain-containing protein
MAVRQRRKGRLKYIENRLFALLCVFSAVWSLGFWGINVQTIPERANLFRAIAMFGVFSFLIVVQLLVCRLAEVAKSYAYPITFVATLGYIICIFISRPDQVTFEMTEWGMTYRFNTGLWSRLYVTYIMAVSISILISIVYVLLHTNRKRMRVLAGKMLLAEATVVLGSVFDTILPLFGKPAIPASTIGQFLALLTLGQAISFLNRFRITIDNMSTYVYSSLTTPVLVYDNHYKLQILNDVAFDFIGLKKTEMETAGIDALFEVQEQDVFQFQGKRKDVDTLCYHNQLPCNLSVSKIHDDYYDVIGYIIIVSDLSERLEYIKRLEMAIQEADTANQAKTVFLANMSHEIRTPMNAIIGFTELALKKDISKEVREYVEDIHLASRNLLAIINDILDITKIESGKMEIVPDKYFVAELFDDVSLIVSQQAAAKGLEFEMTVDKGVPIQLWGDKIRLRGVLINLLNNAVKYTKAGRVSFEVKVLEKKEGNVKFAFVVRDTGIGIKQEDLKYLFKSFERLDQQVHYGVEGSGLGLAIAKGYIALMGGDITVESVYGEGSVFTVTVEQKILDDTPLDYQLTSDRIKQDTASASRLMVKDTRVLLVDDNHTNLMVAQGLLESYGLEVDTASSGAGAIESCKYMHYPLIFMDQMMPEIDGTEAMRRIRSMDSYYAAGGESKIIVLTADAIRGVRENLLAKGFDEYLGKPMNLRQLERLLEMFLPADKITYPQEEPAVIESEKDGEIRRLQAMMPGMDVPFGVENAGGKVEDYLKILKINYTYGEGNIRELEELLDKEDYENYTIKIHAMKSTTKGIGAMHVSELALQQETAGRAGRYEEITGLYRAFKLEYEEMLGRIETVLRDAKLLEENVPQEEKPMTDSAQISNMLINIRNHVDNFEFAEVFAILEDMKKYRFPEDMEKALATLNELMENLDVDAVKKLLEETMDKYRQ